MGDLSWTPKRQGNRYCAPACGRGCTIGEFRRAERQALKMAARLSLVQTDVKGGRWKIRVHENLGWHWSVSKGLVVLHADGGNSYSAFLEIAGPWGGNLVVSARSPHGAVKAVLSQARAQLKPMTALAKRLGS
jgi:hypothetical protein